MTGVVRGVACAVVALAAACGPTYVDGPNAAGPGTAASGDDDTQGSTSLPETLSASVSETATVTATDTATLTATDTATETATATATFTATDPLDSGGDAPSDTLSMVACQDDGTISMLLQVYVLAPIEGCVPPADVGPASVLIITIADWDGEAGGFIADNTDVMATYDLEQLAGTLDVEVSAPYHPSLLEYDLTGTATHLTGSVELETCSFVEEPPCPAATTTN